LLMQLDQLPSYVVVIAATNHAELLDRAVWRRFQMRLSFPAPDQQLIQAFLENIVTGWPNKPRLPTQKIAAELGCVSYAETLDFCQNARRRQILGLGEVSIDEALAKELELWTSRVRPDHLDAQRPDEAATEASARRSAKAGRRQKTIDPAP